MRLTENRTLACAVLVICILVSVFAFGGGALSRERARVLKVFNEGTDSTLNVRHSMDAYLDSAAESAQIMASEAAVYQPDNQKADSVARSAEVLGDDSAGPDARYEAFSSLKTDIEKLYSDLKTNLSDDSFRDFKLAYDDFWGAADLIKRDEYHQLAAKYNDMISGFPGSVVAGITGNGTLNTFGS